MNEKLMRKAGFGKQVDLVKQGRCPICSEVVDLKRFRDEASRREFKLSGMCQRCQDEFFGTK